MPKKTKEENLIISKKIMTLRGEGFERRQAAAIALRMYRDGELPRAVKPIKTPNRLRKSIRGRKPRRPGRSR